MGCTTQTGMGAVLDVAHADPADSIAITGLGAVGMAAALTADRICGATVVGVDISSQRRGLASSLGLTVADRVPAGVDTVIECSGNPAALVDAVAATRTGGTIVVAGAPPFGTTVPLDSAELVNRSLRIVGTVEGGSNLERLTRYLDLAREYDILPRNVLAVRPFTDVVRLGEPDTCVGVAKLVLTMS